MRRGSDTDIDILAPDLKEDMVDSVFVTLNQRGVTMKKEAILQDNKAHISLSAEETMKFAAGPIFMQIMANSKDGKTIQSDVIRYSISDTLGGGINVKSDNGFDITSGR